MHKKKRDASKDSNGSAVDPIGRDKSKDPNKKVYRLSSNERKEDVKLLLSVKTVENDDEKIAKVSANAKRKGRLIIGAGKKSSIAASSPEGAKNTRSGARPPTIITNNVNLKNRRLRSQETGVNGPALKT